MFFSCCGRFQDELVDKILLERRLELAYESQAGLI